MLTTEQKNIDQMIDYYEKCIANCEAYVRPEDQDEFLIKNKIVLAALQAYRKPVVKESLTTVPCEWCNDLVGFLGDYAEHIEIGGFKFCPNCGRVLEATQ